MTLAPNSYDGQDIVFTYDPYTIDPLFCAEEVKCTNVSNVAGSTGIACQELDAQNQLTWNFDESDY